MIFVRILMNRTFPFGILVMIALVLLGTTGTTLLYAQTVPDLALTRAERRSAVAAPPAVTGDNIYVTWWFNQTGNDEVFFRASTDAGQTFGNQINLSNTTDADSTRVEIDSDADSVVVTWWETNQTDDTPVMRVSNDNGETFGPLLKLDTNGTIGSVGNDELN